MKTTKIFFDCEFTWLHQNTTLISIWLISECWKTFYAEFTDYNKNQVNDWIKENVINKLIISWEWCNIKSDKETTVKGDTAYIQYELLEWLGDFEYIEIWSDCLSYDWVLFNTLLSNYSDWYPQLPENVYYIPFDICTLFKIKWIDADISREEFVKEWEESWFWEEEKHNSLFDARIIKMCYEKIEKETIETNKQLDKILEMVSVI